MQQLCKTTKYWELFSTTFRYLKELLSIFLCFKGKQQVYHMKITSNLHNRYNEDIMLWVALSQQESSPHIQEVFEYFILLDNNGNKK